MLSVAASQDDPVNSNWHLRHPGRLKIPFWCRQTHLCHCQSLMKWVFMQACTQFKLKLSLSTDRISNQSTTHSPGGRAALMNLENRENRKASTKRAHAHFAVHFQSLFSTIPEKKDKNHKEWRLYCGSSESSVELHSCTKRGYFECFCTWQIYAYKLIAKKKTNASSRKWKYRDKDVFDFLNDVSSDNEFSVRTMDKRGHTDF